MQASAAAPRRACASLHALLLRGRVRQLPCGRPGRTRAHVQVQHKPYPTQQLQDDVARAACEREDQGVRQLGAAAQVEVQADHVCRRHAQQAGRHDVQAHRRRQQRCQQSLHCTAAAAASLALAGGCQGAQLSRALHQARTRHRSANGRFGGSAGPADAVSGCWIAPTPFLSIFCNARTSWGSSALQRRLRCSCCSQLHCCSGARQTVPHDCCVITAASRQWPTQSPAAAN